MPAAFWFDRTQPCPPHPVFGIFVSSPGDVGREREMARKIIGRVEARLGRRIKLEPYFLAFEPMLATRGDFQRNIPDPASFDLVVRILWSRLGTPLEVGERRDGPGTESDFESAVDGHKAKGKP